ncbi:unnamed protein product, partial [Phaeothamnion confervicola]
DGISALAAASVGGHRDIVRVLLEVPGAEVNDRDRDGLSCLMNASEIGADEVVALLLAKGKRADPNAISTTGFTPLILAAAGGHSDVVRLLLGKGADVNAEHPERVTPLMYAAAGGHLVTADILLQAGAAVNQLHAHGGSALLEACTSGDERLVELLLKAGADAQVRDRNGVTALMSAASAGRLKVSQPVALLGRAPSHRGATALMVAAGAGHEAVVVALLEGGADVRSVDETG